MVRKKEIVLVYENKKPVSIFAGLIADVSNSYIPAFNASGATLLVASSLMFLRKWTKGHSSDERMDREQLVINDKDDFLQVTERETVL